MIARSTSLPPTDRRAWAERGALVALSVALGAMMATPTVDPTAQWVLKLVGDIAPGDWWRPFTPPPPAYGSGFRPVSVLLIQAYMQVFGAHAPPPPWLIFGKGAISLGAFGLAARAWLSRLGAGSLAAPIAALGLLSAPQLF